MSQTSKAQLSLEALEDRSTPSTLVAVFPGYQGLWIRADGATSWSCIARNTPAQVEVNTQAEVLADFQSQGAWYYHRTCGWVQLTTWNPSDIAVASNRNPTTEHVNSDLFMTFPGWGVMRIYRLSTAGPAVTQQITTNFPSQIDAGTDSLAADYDASGLWVWNPGQNWMQLTSADPSDIDLCEYRYSLRSASYAIYFSGYTLAAAFDGHGLWSSHQETSSLWAPPVTPAFSGSAWSQLTAVDPYDVAAGGRGEVAGAFSGYGLFHYSYGLYDTAAGWHQLTTYPIGSVAMASDRGVYATFPNHIYGWQVWNPAGFAGVGTWTVINGHLPNLYSVA